MPRRTLAAAAVGLVAVCPASADTRIVMRMPAAAIEGRASTASSPTLRVSASSPTLRLSASSPDVVIDSVKLSLAARTHYTHARVVIALSTPSTVRRDVETLIDVPIEARVTGMALTLGEGARVPAMAQSPRDAALRYRRITRRGKDPALLRYIRTVGKQKQLSLRVFPLSSEAAAVVELDVELWDVRTLVLASTQRIADVSVEIDGTLSTTGPVVESRAIAMPAAPASKAHGPPLPMTRAVDERMALFADEPGAPAIEETPAAVLAPEPAWLPTVTIEAGSISVTSSEPRTIERQSIRTGVQRRMAQLERCYATEVLRTRSLEGRVDLHFAIVPSGKVSAVTIDGPLSSDAVKQCMATEVGRWSFHAPDATVMVSYPLELRPGR